MTTIWAEVSALVAVGMLGVALLMHVIKYAEQRGALLERLKRLEQEMIEQKGVASSVNDLKNTVSMLASTVHEFRDMVKDLVMEGSRSRADRSSGR